MLLTESKDFDNLPGQRVNNSTFVRSSQVSSSIRITTANNMDCIEEENPSGGIKKEPMLYRTEVDGADRLKPIRGEDSDSDDSDIEIDENENLDKVSEAEDLALKENAAK